jgi:hypothetical protein
MASCLDAAEYFSLSGGKFPPIKETPMRSSVQYLEHGRGIMKDVPEPAKYSKHVADQAYSDGHAGYDRCLAGTVNRTPANKFQFLESSNIALLLSFEPPERPVPIRWMVAQPGGTEKASRQRQFVLPKRSGEPVISTLPSDG